MAKIPVACILIATIIGFTTGRPMASSAENSLSAETRQQIYRLGDEILRGAQEYFELERELELLEKLYQDSHVWPDSSDRRQLGWGPLEESDETAAAVDELTALVLEGVLTAVKELDDSYLGGKVLSGDSETGVNEDEFGEDDKNSKQSVSVNNNVLADDSPAHNAVQDMDNSLPTDDNEFPRALLYHSDNTEDNRLVKRETVDERHRQIDAFLSELDKEIDQKNKGKHDVSSYVGTQFSAPKLTTTERPFWKKIGHAISSSYDKVKSKTKEVVTSVKEHF